MTSEQLLATRATLWRQKAEPLLTLEDAQAWLLQTGLCLFLPRKAQISSPAPSFVEACLGETSPTPPRKAIEGAKELLVRLIESDSALPLNLLGNATDTPDFLVSKEALPFVYALRGDRDWKHAPGTAGANRVTPLITHIWELFERRGVMTAPEIQEELGKELTEAAVLRGLHEMWASLRVVPLYQGGGRETLWEALQARHQKAIISGAGMSQVTALSVMASVYFQSVVAATSDDAETFLSPLASRSKVREVIRGLTATRQLASIQMETQSLLHVEGSLPEFPEVENPAAEGVESPTRPARRPHPTSPEGMEAKLRPSAAGSTPRPAYKRPAAGASSPGRTAARSQGSTFRSAEDRPAAFKRDSGGLRPAASGSRSAFRPKAAAAPERSQPGTGLRADGTPKKPRWRDMPGGRPDQKGKPARFGPRKPDAAGDAPNASGTREPRALRAPAAFRPAFKSSAVGGRSKPFRPAGGDRPSNPGRPSGAYRPTGVGRPATSGKGAPRPSFGAAGGRPPARSFNSGASGSRPPARPFNSGRPPVRSSDARPGSRPPSRSGAGQFAGPPETKRPFFRPRPDEGAGPARPRREGSPGDRPSSSRTARPGGPAPARAGAGPSRSYAPRSTGGPSSGRSSAGRPATGSSFSRSSSSGRPASGRPSSARPSSARPSSARPSSARPASDRPGPGRPASGRPVSGRPPSGRPPGPGYKPSGPRSGGGYRPGGRPPAKFKKRPE